MSTNGYVSSLSLLVLPSHLPPGHILSSLSTHSLPRSSLPLLRSQVAKKLAIFRPPPTLIDAYLDEIARTYGVKWRAAVVVEGEVPGVLDASGEEGTEGEVVEKKVRSSPTAAPAMVMVVEGESEHTRSTRLSSVLTFALPSLF